MNIYDLIIVGGGAAGMMCAINAKKSGIDKVLVLEKNPFLGGALCSADYNISSTSNITGQEYLKKLLADYNVLNINTYLNTMVININDSNEIICVSPERGMEKLSASNIILTNGGKEKGRNALNIPGDRCAGVLTLGNAKNILNMDNIIPGKDIIIYGCENLNSIKNLLDKRKIDIKAIVCDKADNDAYEITDTVYENYKLMNILGKGRVESIIISNGSEEKEITCDTVILSLGMLSDGVVSLRSGIALNPDTTGPAVDDNFETSRKNIFACGNGILIHDSIEQIENEANDLINHIASF